ncbi:glucosyltransferase Alg8 [Histoplasma capsulatum var. duboisii H88]|uniref:Glucosyltransferase Alg8 n=1 Tax=Ajellomyces capsulatus (strain H88) TaxID=544711 RepID=A0A8A1L8R3_AJEC8|nr:glucosyltransferase Alg8 [Histoplasma capsulatum var. duboisii H88]
MTPGRRFISRDSLSLRWSLSLYMHFIDISNRWKWGANGSRMQPRSPSSYPPAFSSSTTSISNTTDSSTGF